MAIVLHCRAITAGRGRVAPPRDRPPASGNAEPDRIHQKRLIPHPSKLVCVPVVYPVSPSQISYQGIAVEREPACGSHRQLHRCDSASARQIPRRRDLPTAASPADGRNEQSALDTLHAHPGLRLAAGRVLRSTGISSRLATGLTPTRVYHASHPRFLWRWCWTEGDRPARPGKGEPA